MTDPKAKPESPATPSLEDRIRPWCERFAAAQQAGRRPEVEEYVGQAPEELRAPLRARLQAMEEEERRAARQTVSRQRFTRLLAKSGLMTRDEIRDFEKSLSPDSGCDDGAELARRLVNAKKLTRFQARAVYRGKTKGLVLGDYVVLDGIGAGGMGLVLKARHQRMDRIVAIKVLPPSAAGSPETVQRFYREVRAAARLVHPNIATAYDAGEHDGTLYLVMEYVDGKDLSQVLKERGPLRVEDAVECVMQAGRGLQYAHDRGVVHRDIKPANLLLNGEGVVKILDMGLARINPPGGESPQARGDTLTSSGQVMGTCDYMAPEQAENLHGSDHRVDIYALGCTLYRLLTNRAPYAGESLIQVLLAHRDSPIPRIRDIRPEAPKALDDVFRRMVAKKPEERPSTMAEVLAALEKAAKRRAAAANLSALVAPEASVSESTPAAKRAKAAADPTEPETIRRSRPESDTREGPGEGETPEQSPLAGEGGLGAWRRGWRLRLAVAAAALLLAVAVAVSRKRPGEAPSRRSGPVAQQPGSPSARAPALAPPEAKAPEAGQREGESEAGSDLATRAKEEALAALQEHFRITHLSLDTAATASPNGADWTVSGHARTEAGEVSQFVCRLSVTHWEDALRWKVVSIDLNGLRKWPPPAASSSLSPPKESVSTSPPSAPSSSSSTGRTSPYHDDLEDYSPEKVESSSSSTGRTSPYSGPSSASPPVSQLGPPPAQPKLLCETSAALDFDEADTLVPLPPGGEKLDAPIDRLLLEVTELESFPSSARISWRNRVPIDQEVRVIVSDQAGVEIHVGLVKSGDGVAARISPIIRGSDATDGELTTRRIFSTKKSFQDTWQAAQNKLVSLRRQIVAYAQQKSAVQKALVAPEQAARKDAQLRLLDQRIADAQQAEKKQAERVAQLTSQGERIDRIAKLIRSLGNSAQIKLRLYQKVP